MRHDARGGTPRSTAARPQERLGALEEHEAAVAAREEELSQLHARLQGEALALSRARADLTHAQVQTHACG